MQMISSNRVRVSVVESNALFLQGYIQLLSKDKRIELVDYSESAKTMYNRLNGAPPDVVLCNLESHDWDATELWSFMHKAYPEVKMVVNSTVHPGPLVKLILQLGISSYFLKDQVDQFELARILLESHHRGHASTSLITEEMITNCNSPQQNHYQHEQLSDREFEILCLTCKGFSRRDISKSMHVAESTVKFHLDKLRERFHCQTVLQLVIRAVREGVVEII